MALMQLIGYAKSIASLHVRHLELPSPCHSVPAWQFWLPPRLSSLDDYSDGHRALRQLTGPRIEQGIQLRGFNFFDVTEQALLLAIQRAEFNIHGLRRADLKKYLPSISNEKLSRYLKRLRVFGLIKRVATREKLTEFTIVQTLADTC
jgi:hypothetical protein